MKRVLKYNFIALFMFVFSFPVFGQSEEAIERELMTHIKNIEKSSNYGGSYDQDALDKENKIFKEKLLKYTRRESTLKYKFGALGEFVSIATSDDGKFRIYSWDDETGGTMHFFQRVYQFQGADGKIYSHSEELEEGDPGSFAYDIFSLDTKAGKIYIVCSTGIGSTNDHFQAADLYKIQGEKLNDKIKLIKTKSGLTNTLGFGYNFFSVVDREERPIRLISFDQKTKTLKIPVVINDEELPNGRVTNKFISYKFNGTYFVKAGR